MEQFNQTRPKPAYGRQGLGWDRRARIQLGQVHLGVDTFWENLYFLKYSGSGFPLLNKCATTSSSERLLLRAG